MNDINTISDEPPTTNYAISNSKDPFIMLIQDYWDHLNSQQHCKKESPYFFATT